MGLETIHPVRGRKLLCPFNKNFSRLCLETIQPVRGRKLPSYGVPCLITSLETIHPVRGRKQKAEDVHVPEKAFRNHSPRKGTETFHRKGAQSSSLRLETIHPVRGRKPILITSITLAKSLETIHPVRGRKLEECLFGGFGVSLETIHPVRGRKRIL